MGMFDYVNVSMPCPNCGTVIDQFQSKDDACNLDTIEPDGLACFYESCCKCGAWVEFNRPRPDPAPKRDKPWTREEVESMGFVLCVTVDPAN